MDSLEYIQGETILDHFYDINIDEKILKKYSSGVSRMTADSRVEENGAGEVCISTVQSQISIRNEKSADSKTDSWAIIDEVTSTSGLSVDQKTTSQKEPEEESAECMTSLRKIILEKILANGNVDVYEMKHLLSCRDIFEENVVLCSLDLLKVDNMFSLIPKLIKVMEFFLDELNAEMDNWSDHSCLSGAYNNVIANVATFYEYNSFIAIVLNILQSCEGIESYNATMWKVMPEIGTPFSDLIHCPIIAHYRMYFGLKELCKYTSRDHMDYYILKETRLTMRKHSCFVPPQINRLHLIKSGYAVELDKNKRKLRFLFLFPKNLIITKIKIKSNQVYYHTKGIVRLGKRMVTIESTDLYDVIDTNVKKIEKAMKKYEKHLDCSVPPTRKCPHISLTCGSDGFQRRLYRLEASLALMLPRLKLTLITTVDKKYYNLLFFSRVEYQTWKDLIENHDYAYTDLVAYQRCIENYGLIPKMTGPNRSSNPLNYYEGTLDVYVHQMKGIVLEAPDVFLTLQVDYFGGFFTRIFTSKISSMDNDPVFDQKFEISLNCSQTLRINAYKRDQSEYQEFQFFAMGTFELHNACLCDHYCLVTVPLMPAESRLHLIMSVRYFSHEFNEKRKVKLDPYSDDLLRLSRMRGRVYGQCIKDVLKREERKIPLIVTSCVEEIEERGLDSSFVYVMRGDDGRVNDLVSVFDICSFTGSYYIKEPRYTPYDIAEVLMRYLRSLPYSILLCPNNYLPVFSLENTAVKVRMVTFLLTNIPEPGRSVFSYLLNHMTKVCLNEPRNRVTPSILGGIFSPVILDSDVTLTLEEYMRKRNHFANILKCMIDLKLEGYALDNTEM